MSCSRLRRPVAACRSSHRLPTFRRWKERPRCRSFRPSPTRLRCLSSCRPPTPPLPALPPLPPCHRCCCHRCCCHRCCCHRCCCHRCLRRQSCRRSLHWARRRCRRWRSSRPTRFDRTGPTRIPRRKVPGEPCRPRSALVTWSGTAATGANVNNSSQPRMSPQMMERQGLQTPVEVSILPARQARRDGDWTGAADRPRPSWVMVTRTSLFSPVAGRFPL